MTATIKSLVAQYNSLTGESVKRFSSVAAGQARIAKVLASRPVHHDTCPSCGATEDQTAAGLEGEAGEYRNFCHHCSTEYFPETGKIYKAPAASATRSQGIKKSWEVKKVAEARAARTKVWVTDVGPFRSVAHAFQSLGMDMRQHIAFRLLLKSEARAKFGKYEFTIVEEVKK